MGKRRFSCWERCCRHNCGCHNCPHRPPPPPQTLIQLIQDSGSKRDTYGRIGYANTYLYTAPKDRKEDQLRKAEARFSKALDEYRWGAGAVRGGGSRLAKDMVDGGRRREEEAGGGGGRLKGRLGFIGVQVSARWRSGIKSAVQHSHCAPHPRSVSAPPSRCTLLPVPAAPAPGPPPPQGCAGRRPAQRVGRQRLRRRTGRAGIPGRGAGARRGEGGGGKREGCEGSCKPGGNSRGECAVWDPQQTTCRCRLQTSHMGPSPASQPAGLRPAPGRLLPLSHSRFPAAPPADDPAPCVCYTTTGIPGYAFNSSFTIMDVTPLPPPHTFSPCSARCTPPWPCPTASSPSPTSSSTWPTATWRDATTRCVVGARVWVGVHCEWSVWGAG